jgi:hypothetical protein
MGLQKMVETIPRDQKDNTIMVGTAEDAMADDVQSQFYE